MRSNLLLSFLFMLALAAHSATVKEIIHVDVVDLFLTALDRDGRYVTDLTRQELMINEDGVPQPIVHFSLAAGKHGEIPLKLAFMVDNSGSMVEDIEGLPKIDLARETGKILANELSPLDQMMVINFDEVPKFTELTSDKLLATEHVQNLRVRFGPTALFDSLMKTIDQMGAEQGRKLLVLCSDGLDNISKNKIEDVIDRMKKTPDLTVLILGTVATDIQRRLYTTVYVSEKGKTNLQRMADATGGFAFYPKSLKEVEKVQEFFRGFIHSQYSIAYKSTNKKLDGSWRNIHITTLRKGVKLRHRTGYFASM